jgi:glycosyltransferase involved in cell wall biosynthesis
MDQKCISIFIPAYNAENHIDDVISRFDVSLWNSIRNVYIINDGSKDATGNVIEKLKEVHEKIITIHFDKNRGYGEVVKCGLMHCKDDGCQFAACLHSDGQYPPESIIPFAGAMSLHSIDIMQGSRIASGTALTGGMPLYKYIAGKCLTSLENVVFGLRLTDYHSGFLLYSRVALEKIKFECLSASFDFDLEVIASARSLGLAVSELPIPTRYEHEKSYLNPILYGLRVLHVLYKYKKGVYR